MVTAIENLSVYLTCHTRIFREIKSRSPSRTLWFLRVRKPDFAEIFT
jgi:hypothetical protein